MVFARWFFVLWGLPWGFGWRRGLAGGDGGRVGRGGKM